MQTRMSDLLPAGRPERHPDVLACPVQEEFLLYHPRSEAAIGLNLSASAVWSLCDGNRSVDAIAAELSELVATEPEDLLPDVARILDELQALDLIVIHPGGATFAA